MDKRKAGYEGKMCLRYLVEVHQLNVQVSRPQVREEIKAGGSDSGMVQMHDFKNRNCQDHQERK